MFVASFFLFLFLWWYTNI